MGVNNLREVDGYSNGFDNNQIKNIEKRIEMKMQRIIEKKIQQIREECNCKSNDYNYNLDSNDYYDD